MADQKRTLLGDNFAPIKCPHCTKTVINLISITDDGEGRKLCRDCKREYKSKHPNMDFSKAKVKK